MNKKQRIYINSIPLNDALKIWEEYLLEKKALNPIDSESVSVSESLNRITSEAVIAKQSSPFFHSSAMDGYAVRFQDTFGVSETKPGRLKIGDKALQIDTGEPIPESFNAVIMIEDINLIKKDRSDYIEIINSATPYQNVRIIGEDIVATELILPENHKIRAIDIGAMLASGITEFKVRKRPRIAIIPTGNEIVEPGTPLKEGNIIDSNSRILEHLLNELRCNAIRYGIVPDEFNSIKATVDEASVNNDLILIIAGSSVGTRDFTPEVISELGEIIQHGVNIKPGRPLLLGWVKEKPAIGIPGYPVSAYLTFNLFVKPLIFKWLGISEESTTIKARLSRHLSSTLGQEEFIRVKVGQVRDNYIATPLSRGAGVLMSLVRGDGILRIPARSEGVAAGSEVGIELIRSAWDISNTIVCIGSHDNTLDILYNSLRKKYPEHSLSSSHVGSLGGILSIRKNETHIAGTHLLDEETGLYNIPFIERLLPDVNVVLMNLVYREQGLIIKKGNPKSIKGFDDLTRDDLTFINRQAGSGTRLLTDKYLKERNISSENIKGFDRVEYTHMGVASAVASGVADTGMGILTSALALDLDFMPVAKERYDLLIRKEYLELPMIKALIDIIQNDKDFSNTISNMGGYDVRDMGKIMYER